MYLNDLSSAAAITSPNGKRPLAILLAEDNRVVAEMFGDALRVAGHDVLIARDGEKAVELATRYPVDLILLDIGLPKCDGLDVLRIIRGRRETARTPVIIFSNSTDPAVIRACRDLGIQGYALKSATTPGELCARLHAWAMQQPARYDHPAAPDG
jgi:CheY-like chemotaxis protein